MTEFLSAYEAAGMIPDGANVAVSGFCGFVSPEEMYIGIRERFDRTGHPKDLTIIRGVGNGDHAERGSSRIAAEGLIRRIISGHVGLEPATSKLIAENKCLAYMLPLGTIMDLLRAAAAHRPGVITTCGLGTYVDPGQEAGKGNRLTKETGPDLCRIVDIGGSECLFYPVIPVDVCIVRATYADEDGNISDEKEALKADQFEAAAAAHNSGGIVIVQVERVIRRGSIAPKDVLLHNFMVDYVVEAGPENHVQGYDSPDYRPELTGEIRVPESEITPLPLDDKKVCCRRAVMGLRPGMLINLGIGMPSFLAAVAAEEGFSDNFTLSIESGVLGGVPLNGLGLGAAVDPEAMYRMADIVDIYDGGGLDAAVLGLAEIDECGNVNVSKFGGSVTGPGGFIDISQNTREIFFIGTFTAGGLRTSYEDGRLVICREGKSVKFKKRVEQITFSGKRAVETGQSVTVITERAVFRLTPEGLMLTEIAPGADLERDILAHMEFTPVISEDLKEMDNRIFREEPVGPGMLTCKNPAL